MVEAYSMRGILQRIKIVGLLVVWEAVLKVVGPAINNEYLLV